MHKTLHYINIQKQNPHTIPQGAIVHNTREIPVIQTEIIRYVNNGTSVRKLCMYDASDPVHLPKYELWQGTDHIWRLQTPDMLSRVEGDPTCEEDLPLIGLYRVNVPLQTGINYIFRGILEEWYQKFCDENYDWIPDNVIDNYSI